jgi:hypothetical protein
MAGSSWPASGVTREYLQNLIHKGYMTVVEFASCLVPVDPMSPALGSSSCVRPSMSGDLVRHRIDSSAPYSGPMAWSYIT